MRTTVPLTLLLCAALAGRAGAQPPTMPDSATARALAGTWLGAAWHGAESTAFGLSFERADSGRVNAKLWLPDLNCYGTEIGYVTTKGGQLAVRGAGLPITLTGDSLTGTVFGPLVRYGVTRGGVLPAKPLLPESPAAPAPRWSYRAAGALWASPVVRAGVVYVGDAGGKFHAVGAADGKVRWTYDAPGAIYGTAAVTADAVYFVADPGVLVKLDRAQGRELWRVPLGPPEAKRDLPSNTSAAWDYLAPTPLVEGDMVCVGSADSVFRALDAKTGRERWTHKAGGGIRAGACADAGHVYVGSLDHLVYALDKQTGAEAWRFDTKSAVTYGPGLANGRVVVGTRDSATLYALDPATGQPAWSKFFWMSWVESTPRVVDGVLYIGSSDSQRVRALDPATGDTRWSAWVGGWTWGTPLVVGDTVYYGTAGTATYFVPTQASLGALDRKTGAVLWRTSVALKADQFASGYGGSLAYEKGLVFAGGLDGMLIAFPAAGTR